MANNTDMTAGEARFDATYMPGSGGGDGGLGLDRRLLVHDEHKRAVRHAFRGLTGLDLRRGWGGWGE